MKPCFIHAGTHKTGTTFLQAALARIQPTLSRHGCLVPDIGLTDPKLAAHHNLAFEVSDRPEFRPACGTVDQLCASLPATPHDRLVLSSECFSVLGRNPAHVARLRTPFHQMGYSITWVFYLRSYHDWLESYYAQQIKMGATPLGFPNWIEKRERFLMTDPAKSLLPFFETGDTVVLRSYSLARKDLMQDFLATIGLPNVPVEPATDDRVNSRHNALQIEFLRRIAAHGTKNLPRKDASRLMARARKLCTTLPESPDFSPMSTGSARALFEETRPSYEKLLQHAHIDTPFETFFPPPSPRNEQTFATLDFPPPTRKALRSLVEQCLGNSA